MIPFLSTEQMRAVDEAMIEDYHIELDQMMENAGRHLAHLARTRFMDGDPRERDVLILAGRGGNGGGGLVAARRLSTWGANVHVVTTHPPEDYRGVPAHQLDSLRQMDISIQTAEVFSFDHHPDLIIDAIIGYGLNGSPRGPVAKLIAATNAQNAPILSLDIPSGLDSTTGKAHLPTIRATATLTLALPKEGLRAPGAAAYVGELYLADISVPPELYERLGIEVGPIFAQHDILQIEFSKEPKGAKEPKDANEL